MARAKLRFVLLTLAVSLLVFLVLFQQTLASSLITQFIGALRNNDADVIVISRESRSNLEASQIDPALLDQIRAVPGVAQAELLGQGTFAARTQTAPGTDGAASPLRDVTVWGYAPGGPGAPTGLTAGRLPSADNEAVTTNVAEFAGFELGKVLTFQPGGRSVTIVGVGDDLVYGVSPALFVTYATYEGIVAETNPSGRGVLPTGVLVRANNGTEPAALAGSIDAAMPTADGLTRQQAEAENPGVSAVSASFNVIFLLFYIVIPLVIGLFFLILTFQKANPLTLLRAIGAPSSKLISALIIQVLIVVTIGIAIAIGLVTLLAGIGFGNLNLRLQTGPVITTTVIVVVLALLASLAAIRRVLRIDPVRATTGQVVA